MRYECIGDLRIIEGIFNSDNLAAFPDLEFHRMLRIADGEKLLQL